MVSGTLVIGVEESIIMDILGFASSINDIL